MKTEWKFNRQGRIATEGGSIWYGTTGNERSTSVPLIVIHGGPGLTHSYLYPMTDLGDERQVIFYDQLDAGHSDRPNDSGNWNIARFLREVDDLRAALDLHKVAIIGNSWGGTIAAAYAANSPAGLEKLILSSPLIDTKQWISDNQKNREALPPEVVSVMDRCERQGLESSQEYQDAVEVFYNRHFCRADPWPDYVIDTMNNMNETCYEGMWGPNEFTCNSELLGNYNALSELESIKVPTLVTCGEYDEAAPASCRTFTSLIPNARFAKFEDASHLTFVEKREEYINALRQFLAE